jgi:hypothetical protein
MAEPEYPERVGFSMVFAAATFLLGFLLAQHCKVLALLPASALALTVGIGIAHADPAAWIAWTVISAIVALQFGYVIGLVVRHVLAAGRTGRAAAPFSSSSTSRRLGAR